MQFLRRVCAGALLVSLAACGGEGGGTPTNPSPSPSQTRVIAISGDLSFGDVLVGQSAERPITISNNGNASLSVTGLTGPADMNASWTSGNIQAGGSQPVTIRFAPTQVRSYVGVITVNANHTSGSNTIPVNARGVNEPFARSGSGNAVFDMPTTVQRVRIFGRWSGRGTSNFIVHIGGRSVVNAILRDQNPYEGVHLVTGGVVEIVNSENITEWRFTEER